MFTAITEFVSVPKFFISDESGNEEHVGDGTQQEHISEERRQFETREDALRYFGIAA